MPQKKARSKKGAKKTSSKAPLFELNISVGNDVGEFFTKAAEKGKQFFDSLVEQAESIGTQLADEKNERTKQVKLSLINLLGKMGVQEVKMRNGTTIKPDAEKTAK